MAGVRSTPVTDATCGARARLRMPGPLATSSQRCPGASGSSAMREPVVCCMFMTGLLLKDSA